MIETKYVVIRTNNHNYCTVENTQTFDEYHKAMEYRDKKRELEQIEKGNYYYNVSSFNIIRKGK